ncbi:hypothetical protein Pint_36242 [Pistacia integerrima]|uniref:Uncharacterized protein n=1 Tax=Pistacia integerrima TaxID=434235 RepID=A0ACC0Y455_9ROSI|nr:hypothetical protein Pint_36242 [Pistacia integerrima]
MDLEVISPSRDLVKCCNCGCSCASISSSSGTWLRSVKRKYDEFEDKNGFFIPGLAVDSNPRVQIENECAALRETVASQQQAIQDLYVELEEERNASSSAANEAMSMILRLQREKAEVQMEARQFKRFAEEKMSHDQQELLALEDLLYKREQAIQAFTCEVQAYKHRMMSYGITEAEADDVEKYPFGETPRGQNEKYTFGETPQGQNEKYPYAESPRTQNRLKNLEYRIYQMERSPRKSQLDGDFSSGKNILEKVIVDQSPRRQKHNRRSSNDSSSSNMGMFKETGSDFVTESPRYDTEDPDIKKLYMRLQALEADRESMRQAIISMRTDKAQMVLLKEIAQHLCKEMSPERQMPVRKLSVVRSFSFMSIFKWIVSFVFWRRRASYSKYTAGLTANNVGLLLLLDRSPRMRQSRCVSSTQV